MKKAPSQRGPLYMQLNWFIQLRWLAAAGVIAASLAGRWLPRWDELAVHGLVLGLAIAGYNLAVRLMLRRVPAAGQSRRRLLLTLAGAQILLDLGCLTLLALWSGGALSPVSGFFVFHMVIASLLLPPLLAYGGAAAAVLLMAAGLTLTRQWPADPQVQLVAIGWVLTLLLTVYLTSRITRILRGHQRRLVRQNRRIRAMTDMLRRQQRNMVQHEKMVAMGQMAAGITHEITNPLASMDSLLQLLQRRPERINADTLTTLRDQVQRIDQIIQQMKTFAHPADQQRQTMAVNEVVRQALDVLRFDRRIKPVTLSVELADDAGEIPLLVQPLQQVLVNLIINALDALQDIASPRLTVRTARQGGWVSIEVRDNGPGIRPEHRGRIFEPFFTTKPVGKGTGLGLSISYSLVRRQGGELLFRCEPAGGVTFTVLLPVECEPSREREAAGDAAVISEKPT